MPGFSKGSGYRTPFGKNVFLRSTQDVKTESYTTAAASVPTRDVDGDAIKALQPGTVMAKITSGVEAGKIGPFENDINVVDGRQTLANIVGVNQTFLPWQLNERDVEVSIAYEASVVQSKCLEHNGTDYIALTDTTAAAMFGTKGLDIRFA